MLVLWSVLGRLWLGLGATRSPRLVFGFSQEAGRTAQRQQYCMYY